MRMREAIALTGAGSFSVTATVSEAERAKVSDRDLTPPPPAGKHFRRDALETKVDAILAQVIDFERARVLSSLLWSGRTERELDAVLARRDRAHDRWRSRVLKAVRAGVDEANGRLRAETTRG